MATPLSRREIKSAEIKLGILHQTVSLIGKGSFKDLYVDDICSAVGISKVTFFKYFRQKEDILVYFMQVWCFQVLVQFTSKKYEGLNAIKFIFTRINQDVAEHFNLMLALIGYITSLTQPPQQHTITLAERTLLVPGVPNLGSIELLNIQQIFHRHVQEAIALKELNAALDVKEAVQLITSLFYGTALVAHINGVQDKHNLYNFHIETILKAFQ